MLTFSASLADCLFGGVEVVEEVVLVLKLVVVVAVFSSTSLSFDLALTLFSTTLDLREEDLLAGDFLAGDFLLGDFLDGDFLEGLLPLLDDLFDLNLKGTYFKKNDIILFKFKILLKNHFNMKVSG